MFYLSLASTLHNLKLSPKTSVMKWNIYSFNDYTPDEPVKRFRYIESLKCGLNVPCILLCYSPGSNIGNQYYLWKVNEGDDVLTNSEQVIEAIKMNLPVRYHTRAMRKVLFKKYGRLCPSMKPSALRFLYHDLAGKHYNCKFVHLILINKNAFL